MSGSKLFITSTSYMDPFGEKSVFEKSTFIMWYFFGVGIFWLGCLIMNLHMYTEHMNHECDKSAPLILIFCVALLMFICIYAILNPVSLTRAWVIMSLIICVIFFGTFIRSITIFDNKDNREFRAFVVINSLLWCATLAALLYLLFIVYVHKTAIPLIEDSWDEFSNVENLIQKEEYVSSSRMASSSKIASDM